MLTKRGVITLVLVVIMLMCTAVSGFAATGNTGTVVLPNYAYTDNVDVTLSISNGVATARAVINGELGLATKVCIYMDLEKFDEDDKTWDTVKSWSGVFNDSKGALEKTKTVTSGAYRLKVSFWAYAGTASENFVQYSTIERC